MPIDFQPKNLSKEASRTDKFKSCHCVGQIVEGTFVDIYNEKLNWVNINGHYLLAGITEPQQKGEKFLFEIVQLEPDIVLKPTDGTAQKANRLNLLV